MTIDYASLASGQVISERTYLLDADTIGRYVDAVDDRSELFTQAVKPAVAPPMAIAALGLLGAITDLAIPGGTLHSGQELEFNGVVQVNETLKCIATVVQNSVRGEWRFMVVQLAVQDSDGQSVMSGKSTIVLPV